MMSNKFLTRSAALLAALVLTTTAGYAAGVSPLGDVPSSGKGALIKVDKDGPDVSVTISDGQRRHYSDDYYDDDHDEVWYESRGYRRYEVRPDDWRERSCVGVGPIHFCK